MCTGGTCGRSCQGRVGQAGLLLYNTTVKMVGGWMTTCKQRPPAQAAGSTQAAMKTSVAGRQGDQIEALQWTRENP